MVGRAAARACSQGPDISTAVGHLRPTTTSTAAIGCSNASSSSPSMKWTARLDAERLNERWQPDSGIGRARQNQPRAWFGAQRLLERAEHLLDALFGGQRAEHAEDDRLRAKAERGAPQRALALRIPVRRVRSRGSRTRSAGQGTWPQDPRRHPASGRRRAGTPRPRRGPSATDSSTTRRIQPHRARPRRARCLVRSRRTRRGRPTCARPTEGPGRARGVTAHRAGRRGRATETRTAR